MSATRSRLSGGRWHFQHGPIDVVLGAQGDAHAVAAAHAAAWARFTTVLDELVGELAALRRPVGAQCPVEGGIARRMWQACHPFRDRFVTPMAAVAGAVAQELVAAYARAGIERAWVNNGGDIALHLAPGASCTVGLYADLARYDAATAAAVLATDVDFTVHADLPVRGVATSGWRGRSFSLGIADSVTVLAATAAEADAAATMIANAVAVDAPGIVRRPACEVRDDTDLGRLPVTVDVCALDDAAIAAALTAGAARARAIRAAGLCHAAILVCQGWVASIDATPKRLAPPRDRHAAQPARLALHA